MSDSKLYTIELGGDLGDIAAMHRLVRCKVSCSCAAVGPSSGTRAEAVARWNERREPVQRRLFGGVQR